MDSDRDILIAALQSAARIYRENYPQPTLLGSDPDSTVIDPISTAIGRCSAYKAVAGKMVYSGSAGPVLHASMLADLLFRKGVRHWLGQDDIPGAVEWLLRVLTTRETLGLFKAAIWGFSIDEDVIISGSSRLTPFGAMPDSYMKGRISDRAKPCYDGSVWMSHTYFDAPSVALVKQVPNFAYISADGVCFRKIAELQQEARDLFIFIGAASIGQPLAIGCWFEYADEDLDFAQWQNTTAWILPEVHPYIASCTVANAKAIQEDLRTYAALPEELRSDLLRSMNRYTLSHCRHQFIDRILDLALAFEIAVSGNGDSAPVSWKVGVRSTQLIGGALEMRKSNRRAVNELYKLRNRATHGSSLNTRDRGKQENVVSQCSDIYRDLLRSFLLLGRKPEWDCVELEPPFDK